MKAVCEQLTLLVLLAFVSLQLVRTAVFNQSECKKLKTPKMRRSCCNLPQTDDIIQKCRKDILTAQKIKLEAEKKNHSTSSQLSKLDKLGLKICIAECEFKVKNYLTAPLEVDLKVIEKDLQSRFVDDKEYTDLMMKGFNKCLQFAQNKTKDFSWLRSEKDCNMFPAALLACASEAVYENCPTKKWHSTPQCDRMREYLVKCDELEMEKTFHFK